LLVTSSGVRRGPVGRRRSLLLLGDRLTARPKHSDFRERISLRGEIKERRSSVEADTSRKALQAFRESVSMTEGARSFRRRGALALRFSLETEARQKRAAERSNATALHLEVSTHAIWFHRGDSGSKQFGSTKFRHCSGRRACSCSTSPLSRLKDGERKRREGLARGPADNAAEGVALSKRRTARTLAR